MARVSVQEACHLLGISDSTLRRRIRAGLLEAVKQDGQLLINLPDADHQDNRQDDELMTLLMEQLKVKDEQIRARDVQISQLVYELGELRQHLALPAPASTKRRGWWRRLFSAA